MSKNYILNDLSKYNKVFINSLPGLNLWIKRNCFFIDDSIIPKDHSSPFLHIHEIEKDEKSTKPKIDVNKGPFAKLKNYSKPKPKIIQPIKKEQTIPTHIKNKFVHLGKIYKFSPLQKVKRESQTIERKEPIAMNYSTFKQWHNPEKFDLIAT